MHSDIVCRIWIKPISLWYIWVTCNFLDSAGLWFHFYWKSDNRISLFKRCNYGNKTCFLRRNECSQEEETVNFLNREDHRHKCPFCYAGTIAHWWNFMLEGFYYELILNLMPPAVHCYRLHSSACLVRGCRLMNLCSKLSLRHQDHCTSPLI